MKTGPAAEEGGDHADEHHHDPGAAHVRSPRRQAAAAATIGTPIGVTGVSANVMAAARAAAWNRPPITHVRHREGEKESREGSIQPERVRILHHTSDHGSRGGAADPEHVEQKAGPDEDRPLECPSPPRERPRLVDDRLGLHEPAKRPPGEDRCNGHADRDVPRVQEHGREDRGRHRPAGVETDTAANCADPANVVADMTTVVTAPNPAASARTRTTARRAPGSAGGSRRASCREYAAARGRRRPRGNPSRRSRCDNPFA